MHKPDAASAPNGTPSSPHDERLHRFAHDVKNRIGTALAATRMLREAPPAEERHELADHAERSLFHALHAIERMLDDLGVERGTVHLDRVPVDIHELIDQAIGDAGARLERKGQVIAFERDQPLPVLADRDLIRQVLFALLTNASKFSPQGAVIRIETERAGDEAHVRVIDHGAGLSAGDLEQVFQRYAWLGSRSTAGESQDRGTLARSRPWVLAHQGDLEAHSDGPGRGSTFTLRLPLIQ